MSKPKKNFGQNFLIDQIVLGRIIDGKFSISFTTILLEDNLWLSVATPVKKLFLFWVKKTKKYRILRDNFLTGYKKTRLI